jgi:hypothetical protein
LVGVARRWGFGRLEVLNLCARVSPTPAALRQAANPVGLEDDHWIQRRLEVLESDGMVWVGWGNGGGWRGRDRWLFSQLGQ